MKFNFRNFGKIVEGTVETKDLTIICGPNGTGKTYISYAIHSFLRGFEQLSGIRADGQKTEELMRSGSTRIPLNTSEESVTALFQRASTRFTSNLHDYFSVEESFFEGASISVTPSEHEHTVKDEYIAFAERGIQGFRDTEGEHLIVTGEVNDRVMPRAFYSATIGEWIARSMVGSNLPTPFPITSERTGISLFWKDLDLSRNQVFERFFEAGKKEVEIIDILLSASSRYAMPIKENIDVVRSFEDTSKKKSALSETVEGKYVIALLDRIVEGAFTHDGKSLNFSFKVKGVRKRREIPIYVASSSIKSIFLLSVYVKHLAKSGDLLIIDEPELNLHPDNQRLIAGVVVALVNAGIKVLVTTHSDFFVREISGRIALGEKSTPSRILEKYSLNPQDLLKQGQVAAYVAKTGRISQVSVDDGGIDMDTLSSAISSSNEFYEDALLS